MHGITEENFFKAQWSTTEVLSYYDCPLIFVIEWQDRLYYVHWATEEWKSPGNYYEAWLAREITLEELELIKNNKLSIKHFLTKTSRLIFVEIKVDNGKTTDFLVSERLVYPLLKTFIPEDGIYLCPKQ
jgi:hypothetical protein